MIIQSTKLFYKTPIIRNKYVIIFKPHATHVLFYDISFSLDILNQQF